MNKAQFRRLSLILLIPLLVIGAWLSYSYSRVLTKHAVVACEWHGGIAFSCFDQSENGYKDYVHWVNGTEVDTTFYSTTALIHEFDFIDVKLTEVLKNGRTEDVSALENMETILRIGDDQGFILNDGGLYMTCGKLVLGTPTEGKMDALSSNKVTCMHDNRSVISAFFEPVGEFSVRLLESLKLEIRSAARREEFNRITSALCYFILPLALFFAISGLIYTTLRAIRFVRFGS